MEQENQQNDHANPATVPVKRKRGNPQRDEVPVSEPSSRIQQQHRADSPAGTSRGFVGQAISGTLDGTFEAGYLLTVRMGTTGQVFKGMVFHPHTSILISAENDIASNLPMSHPNDMVPPTMPETSKRALVPATDQPTQQNVRADQALPRYDPASVCGSLQPVQQIIKQNVRVDQALPRSDPAAVCGSVQPVQQIIRASPVLTRYEPAAVPIPAPPMRQNVRGIQPLGRNEPAAVPTPALPVQPLSRVGPAGIFTAQPPMQQNVRSASPLPSIAPVLPSQLYQMASSLYAQNVVLNDAGRGLQPGSRPKVLQASSQVAVSTANASSSAVPQHINSEAMNVQTATSGGPATAVAKEEEAPVTIPPPVQTGEAVEAPHGRADSHQRGSASGSAVQSSKPEALVVRIKPEPEDSSTGELNAGASAAPQPSVSQAYPKTLEAHRANPPGFSKPMPRSDASA